MGLSANQMPDKVEIAYVQTSVYSPDCWSALD